MTSLLTRTPTTAPPSVTDAPATSLAGTVAEDLALVVAPTTGRFRPSATDEVVAGDVVGHITGGQGRADVVLAPTGGSVARLLVRPGQLVGRGQGLVWLRRSMT